MIKNISCNQTLKQLSAKSLTGAYLDLLGGDCEIPLKFSNSLLECYYFTFEITCFLLVLVS